MYLSINYNTYLIFLSYFSVPPSNVPRCIPPAINEFPADIFTQGQRQKGFVVIHIIATAYLCLILAVICDQFFVPTLEIIAEGKLYSRLKR